MTFLNVTVGVKTGYPAECCSLVPVHTGSYHDTRIKFRTLSYGILWDLMGYYVNSLERDGTRLDPFTKTKETGKDMIDPVESLAFSCTSRVPV